MFCVTISKATAISSVTTSFLGYDAPLMQSVELLSISVAAQISSDFIVCFEVRPIPLHGVGATVDGAVW